VLLIGHAGHPEVDGTLGQVPAGSITLIENVADAESVAVPDPEKLSYTTQTTLSVDDTAAIIATLKRRFPEIEAPGKADICYATTNRQDAVKAIAPRADALLVIGAPNSSNSRRLVEVAAAHGCPRAVLIERAADIDWADFEGVATVAITAGASAPEVLVQEVIETLGHRFAVTVENVVVREENVVFSLPRALVG
jgi:4-hydroxy-3-methylbut-2-enyl diphosphate reductase